MPVPPGPASLTVDDDLTSPSSREERAPDARLAGTVLAVRLGDVRVKLRVARTLIVEQAASSHLPTTWPPRWLN